MANGLGRYPATPNSRNQALCTCVAVITTTGGRPAAHVLRPPQERPPALPGQVDVEDHERCTRGRGQRRACVLGRLARAAAHSLGRAGTARWLRRTTRHPRRAGSAGHRVQPSTRRTVRSHPASSGHHDGIEVHAGPARLGCQSCQHLLAERQAANRDPAGRTLRDDGDRRPDIGVFRPQATLCRACPSCRYVHEARVRPGTKRQGVPSHADPLNKGSTTRPTPKPFIIAEGRRHGALRARRQHGGLAQRRCRCCPGVLREEMTAEPLEPFGTYVGTRTGASPRLR